MKIVYAESHGVPGEAYSVPQAYLCCLQLFSALVSGCAEQLKKITVDNSKSHVMAPIVTWE